MESLLEYNKLMDEAGLGYLAKKQYERHKPNPSAQLPEYMLSQSACDQQKYLKRKKYRESEKVAQRLKEYRRQKVVCECGKTISKPNIHVHQTTTKCKKKIQRLQQKKMKPVTTNHAFVCSILAQKEQASEELFQPLLPFEPPPLSGQPPSLKLPALHE